MSIIISIIIIRWNYEQFFLQQSTRVWYCSLMMSKRSANGWEPSFSFVFLSDERERRLPRKEECYSMIVDV
jgi:hypothetical protein